MDGFGTREGEEADDSLLTLAVSCLMSYERTGECTIPPSLPFLHVCRFITGRFRAQTTGSQICIVL